MKTLILLSKIYIACVGYYAISNTDIDVVYSIIYIMLLGALCYYEIIRYTQTSLDINTESKMQLIRMHKFCNDVLSGKIAHKTITLEMAGDVSHKEDVDARAIALAIANILNTIGVASFPEELLKKHAPKVGAASTSSTVDKVKSLLDKKKAEFLKGGR